MLPYPIRNIDPVTVTQCVNNRCYPRHIVATSREAMPPAVPSRRSAHHSGPVSVIGVCPLFAQLSKFDHATAFVVIGHPTRY